VHCMHCWRFDKPLKGRAAQPTGVNDIEMMRFDRRRGSVARTVALNMGSSRRAGYELT